MQLFLPAFFSSFPQSFPPFFSPLFPPFFFHFIHLYFFFILSQMPLILSSLILTFPFFISVFFPHISLFSHTLVFLHLTHTHVLTKSQRLKHTEGSTFRPFISSGFRWFFPDFWAAHVGDWGCSSCYGFRCGPLYLFQQQIILHLQVRWNFYKCLIV